MRAKQLYTVDHEPVEAFQCGVCGTIWSCDPEHANSCCSCSKCGVLLPPSKRGSAFRTCERCWELTRIKNEQETLNRAQLIEDYDGPVWWNGTYWSSVEDCLDSFSCDDSKPPEYVYCCSVHHYQIDATRILVDLLENIGVEDHDESVLIGVKEFEKAVQEFNEKNRGPKAQTYWQVDDSKKVRLIL